MLFELSSSLTCVIWQPYLIAARKSSKALSFAYACLVLNKRCHISDKKTRRRCTYAHATLNFEIKMWSYVPKKKLGKSLEETGNLCMLRLHGSLFWISNIKFLTASHGIKSIRFSIVCRISYAIMEHFLLFYFARN